MAEARAIIARWLHAQYGGNTLENFGGDADALIEDLSAAGLKVVGRNPTDEMLAGIAAVYSVTCAAEAFAYWRAMFDAAPPTPATLAER